MPTSSRPPSLSGASPSYVHASLYGRCDQATLIDPIRTTLGLYFVPNETPEERMRQVAMIVEALADMSEDCVWWALREWRRTQDRRPSPAALRQLCMRRRQEAVACLPKPEPAPAPYREAAPEDLAERAAILARVCGSAGFVQTQHGQWTLPEEEKDKPARVPHWSETAAPDDPRWEQLRRSRAASGLV